MSRRLGRLLIAAAAALLAATAVSAFTAGNAVPGTNVGRLTFPIDANALKPPECAGLNLTTILIGQSGGSASELILGTAAAETLKGNGGDDCVIGGGGNDSLWGDNIGTSVCMGGPGTDFFKKCTVEVQ